MSEMSGLILRVMRTSALAAAGFVVLVIAIEIWTKWRIQGVVRENLGFMVVLLVMLAGCLWLARAISREIARSGP